MRRPTSSLVDETEDMVEAGALAGLEDLKALRKSVGERRIDQVRLTPDDKALLQVPLWRVGRLDPAYWRNVAATFGGPHVFEKHEREMQRLSQSKPEVQIPGMESLPPVAGSEVA